MVVAACAVLALGTLAAFDLVGNGSKNDGQTATGSIANASPSPSSGGVLSIPAGSVGKTLTITGDSIWDSSPSAGSQASAANAYSGTGTGWTMTTQTNSNWLSQNGGGGIGLVFDLGAAHNVDQVKFQVADSGATVEVLTGPSTASTSWNTSGLTANGFSLAKTESGVASGQTVTVNFSAVDAQYVAIIFTQLQSQSAISSTNTPEGYRNTLLDVSAVGE
jgi:hypothetical protein